MNIAATQSHHIEPQGSYYRLMMFSNLKTNPSLLLPAKDHSGDLLCGRRGTREDVMVKRKLLGFSPARMPVILCQ